MMERHSRATRFMAEARPKAKTPPKRIRLDKIRRGIQADEAALRRDEASQPERVRLFTNDDGAKLAARRSKIAARRAALEELEQAERQVRAKRRVEARLAEMETFGRP